MPHPPLSGRNQSFRINNLQKNDRTEDLEINIIRYIFINQSCQRLTKAIPNSLRGGKGGITQSANKAT